MTHTVRTKEEQATSLANYLPGGRVFQQKIVAGSNLRNFLKGLSSELLLVDGYLRTYEEETKPDNTVLLLDEWESAVGIPDDCFFGTGSIAERRTHVLVKLASLGVQTEQDFIDLAALFGITVTVGPALGFATFPYTFPMLFLTPTESRFTILITFTVIITNEFPLTFPIVFGDPIIGIVQCLFTKLKPANCDIIFVEV